MRMATIKSLLRLRDGARLPRRRSTGGGSRHVRAGTAHGRPLFTGQPGPVHRRTRSGSSAATTAGTHAGPGGSRGRRIWPNDGGRCSRRATSRSCGGARRWDAGGPGRNPRHRCPASGRSRGQAGLETHTRPQSLARRHSGATGVRERAGRLSHGIEFPTAGLLFFRVRQDAGSARRIAYVDRISQFIKRKNPNVWLDIKSYYPVLSGGRRAVSRVRRRVT